MMDHHKATLNYFLTGQIASRSEQFFYSSNRGEAAYCLEKYLQVCKVNGLNDNDASLVVAALGEITNNSFDHNLGYWKDSPGCCVSWSIENRKLTFCIADRGRGIVESLRHVIEAKKTSQEVLQLAFEKIITGRAPEKRGNGLKFVCSSVQKNVENSLKCFSNGCTYQVNSSTFPVPIDLNESPNFGTLIFFQWRIL